MNPFGKRVNFQAIYEKNRLIQKISTTIHKLSTVIHKSVEKTVDNMRITEDNLQKVLKSSDWANEKKPDNISLFGEIKAEEFSVRFWKAPKVEKSAESPKRT